MSKVNMILFMDKLLGREQKSLVLKEFNAIDQVTQWAVEKNGGWIWIDFERDGQTIWKSITNKLINSIKNVEIKDVIYVRPSKEISTDCLALEFCQAITRLCEGYCNVYLYHEFSGFYKNDEITFLRPISAGQFYDKRKINKDILKQLVDNVLLLFTEYLELVQEWDDDESEYILMFKYLFNMRDDINEYTRLADNSIIANIKKVDEIILEILQEDHNKRLLLSYCYRLEKPIKNWWWHLEKVESGDLVVKLEDGFIEYNNCKISIS